MPPILNRVKFTKKKNVNQHDYGLNLPVTLGKRETNGEANAKGKRIGQGGKESEIHEERKREYQGCLYRHRKKDNNDKQTT